MAITNFIPQVWSARLQENLHKALVFGALCNRNYEGDIAQWGDTVHINVLNDITVKAYDPATDIEDPEQLSGTDTTLTIDHGAYYNFYINDADAIQARVDLMDAAMRNAADRPGRGDRPHHRRRGGFRQGDAILTIPVPSLHREGFFASLHNARSHAIIEAIHQRK